MSVECFGDSIPVLGEPTHMNLDEQLNELAINVCTFRLERESDPIEKRNAAELQRFYISQRSAQQVQRMHERVIAGIR